MSQIVDCSEFCRLCLVKEQVNTPIFEEDGGYHQLSTKISTCLPVKVSREDSLPKRICDGCCYKVEQQYQFWNISLNAEKQFKQWLGISEDTETAKQNVNKIKKESTYDGPSASKRPKRNARRKAVQNIRQATAAQQSDSDSDIPLAARTVAPSIEVEPIAKDENDSDHHDFPEDNDSMDPPNFVNMNLEGEQDQAGPSGLQKAESTEPVEAAPATLNMEIEAGEGQKHHENEGKYKIKIAICNKRKGTVKNRKTKNETIKEELNISNRDSNYTCKLCKKIFNNTSHLTSHMVSHSTKRPFSCDLCDKTYKRNTDLRKHRNLHTGEKRYVCKRCGYFTFSRACIDIHVKRHGDGEEKFKCEECNKEYYTKYDYNRHMLVHSEKKQFSCADCGKSYPYYSSLLTHKHKYHLRKENAFTCEFCGHMTKTKGMLQKHIEYRHGEKKYEICDVCGKQVSLQYLPLHKLIHTGQRKFSCEFCNKSFLRKEYLKIHIRFHTGDKPYQCKICKKSFAMKGSLSRHEKHHTGYAPYLCNLCPKSFVLKTLLNTHLKMHKKKDPT